VGVKHGHWLTGTKRKLSVRALEIFCFSGDFAVKITVFTLKWTLEAYIFYFTLYGFKGCLVEVLRNCISVLLYVLK
jgi:hypothetical protein